MCLILNHAPSLSGRESADLGLTGCTIVAAPDRLWEVFEEAKTRRNQEYEFFLRLDRAPVYMSLGMNDLEKTSTANCWMWLAQGRRTRLRCNGRIHVGN